LDTLACYGSLYPCTDVLQSLSELESQEKKGTVALMEDSCANCGVLIQDDELSVRDPNDENRRAHMHWWNCVRAQQILIANLQARVDELEHTNEGLISKNRSSDLTDDFDSKSDSFFEHPDTP
jgi:hypothetical protein